MTDRLTVSEARAKGLLKDKDELTPAQTSSAALRKAQAEIKRLTAFKKLLADLSKTVDLRIEYQFHPERRWRFDIAVPAHNLALEIDGGGWVGGRHHRKDGRDGDNEKDAEAQLLGWRVLRVGWEHVENGEALELMMRFVKH